MICALFIYCARVSLLCYVRCRCIAVLLRYVVLALYWFMYCSYVIVAVVVLFYVRLYVVLWYDCVMLCYCFGMFCVLLCYVLKYVIVVVSFIVVSL